MFLSLTNVRGTCSPNSLFNYEQQFNRVYIYVWFCFSPQDRSAYDVEKRDPCALEASDADHAHACKSQQEVIKHLISVLTDLQKRSETQAGSPTETLREPDGRTVPQTDHKAGGGTERFVDAKAKLEERTQGKIGRPANDASRRRTADDNEDVVDVKVVDVGVKGAVFPPQAVADERRGNRIAVTPRPQSGRARRASEKGPSRHWCF